MTHSVAMDSLQQDRQHSSSQDIDQLFELLWAELPLEEQEAYSQDIAHIDQELEELLSEQTTSLQVLHQNTTDALI